ncbi:delta-like protein 4 [Engraulis encrasicolus]|uniref:delta-like protein 4 n=1 Tax=Engraulis encrasicolus TaxID=184585 RepID=UPI002FD76815
MALWYNLLLLSIMVTPQAYGSGVFEIDLQEFRNDKNMLSNGSRCLADCRTFFRVCLKNYQREVTPGECYYGSGSTPVLGARSFSITQSGGSSKALRFPIDFSWPGSFSLIIEAWYAPTQDSTLDTSNNNLLISFFATKTNLEAGAAWSRNVLTWRQTELRYSYRFICNGNYYGENCSKKCVPRDDLFGHYTCDRDGNISCFPGYKGKYCEHSICLEGCSKTNGNCTQPGECDCREGWQGVFCDECKRHPSCQHGTCQLPGQCNCDEGWGGILCDQDLNYCTHHRPCVNGTCMNTGQGSFTCTCHPGYTGLTCDRQLTECDGRPCLHGAQCTDLDVGGYVCTCPEGYEGRHCETKVVTCADSPCFHRGRCHDRDEGRSYVCECPAGYTGLNCEKRVDKCTTLRCANGGLCVVEGGMRKCSCRSGFAGLLCEINVDDCANQPCANGSTCQDAINGYKCLCAPGFEGRHCDRPASSASGPSCSPLRPCQNGGTCSPSGACACLAPYAGRLCERAAAAATTTSTPELATPPWAAVLLGAGLVAMLVLLSMVLIVLRFVHKQKTHHHDNGLPDDHHHHRGVFKGPPTPTKNNLSEPHKDNLLSALQLKNTNKRAELEVDCPYKKAELDILDCPNEKLNYKHINYHSENYRSHAEYKQERNDTKGVEDKTHLARIYREKPECRISTICRESRDSMYQSVFVITEERNECVIATEV